MSVLKMNKEYRLGITSFEHFAEIQNRIKDSSSSKIEINCEQTTYISPAFVTLFGSLPHYGEFYNKKVYIKYDKKVGKRYIQDIGLDKYYNNLGSPHKEAVPFSSISWNEYAKDKMDGIEKILRTLPRVDIEVKGMITAALGEILNNAKDHSGFQDNKNVKVYYCGYWNSKIDSYIVSIYDTGVGIQQNVSKYLNEETSDLQAMEWAFGDGNSTQNSDDIDYTRGIGLNSLENLINLKRGILYVGSGNAICAIKNGKRSLRSLKSPIQGTVYVLSIPIKETKVNK